MKRTIVQMSASRNGVYALCDRGSLWYCEDAKWQEIPALPEAEPVRWRPAGSLPIFSISRDGLYQYECISEAYFLTCKQYAPNESMIQANDPKDALRIWSGMNDKSVKTRIERLKIEGMGYDYIREG